MKKKNIKKFKSFDPYNEENWDEERIFITLYRNTAVFQFYVYKAVMGDMHKYNEENEKYMCNYMTIIGGAFSETVAPIEISNLAEEKHKIDYLRSSAQSILLPVDTTREEIMYIIQRVYDRIFKDYKKDRLSCIETEKRLLKDHSDLNNLIKKFEI